MLVALRHGPAKFELPLQYSIARQSFVLEHLDLGQGLSGVSHQGYHLGSHTLVNELGGIKWEIRNSVLNLDVQKLLG